MLLGLLIFGALAGLVTAVAAAILEQSLSVIILAYVGPLYGAVAFGIILSLSRSRYPISLLERSLKSQKGNN